ncbi:MMPL family transporter [Actinomadura formosensis]|uniref:MMPL family transporter n=1 Tax=Actinomadura formosensis TaxID=60706 RepID=UPI00082B1B22|nr:MMPL family transporter [Actinomadura formosensis]
MLAALGRFSARHRWWVLAAWLLLVLGVVAAGRSFGGSFSNDLTLKGADSQAAYDTLRARFPDMSGDGMQVVVHSEKGQISPDVQRKVDAAVADVRTRPDVAAAQSPFGPVRPMVSEDGRTAIATVQFDQRAKDIPEESLRKAQEAFDPVRGQDVQVAFGGAAVQAESGPSGQEIYGLIAAVIVLLIAFGSLAAMLVPILTAIAGVGVGLSLITLLSGVVTIGTSGPVVAAMIGLGVGIDYALLVVTRHREEMAHGLAPVDSIAAAMATAGRSVLVAGTTVIIAILSLYVIGVPFVSALGLAAAVTVAATLLASVTLLPALLGLFGRNLDRLRIGRSGGGHGVAGGWVRAVIRFRWAAIALAVVAFAALALPLGSLRLGTADGGSQPPGSTQRKAYDLVDESFGPGMTGPLLVTVDYGQDGRAAQAAPAVRQAIAQTHGVGKVLPPRPDPHGRTAVLTVVPTGSPDSAATESLVHTLRSDVLPKAAPNAEAHIGGATATSIDLADRLGARMGWFMLMVVGLAFLLLLVEFRSLAVPVVAVLMNLLAVGAAYGPVVAVFQWGWWPASLIGAHPGPVESFAPVMLFAVLFGLSTDYAVFLLSRIHEEFKRHGDARHAVVAGVTSTSRVILAAASVMVVVFTGFVLNDQRVVNLFGFGLATAVALYALLAMMVLVPAVLSILGRSAWWLPGRRTGRGAHRGGEPAGDREPVALKEGGTR